MTLYLFNFNNYYNRIVKKYNTVAQYQQNGDLLHTLYATNFNPSDGITCYHDFNYNGEIPDYMLAVNGAQIVSRWYVTEAKRLQGQQLRISFYRDVIADWWEDIIKAPSFIEKAHLLRSDAGIYNSENMSFNQIRKSLETLADGSGCPWLIGYVPRNAFTEEQSIKIPYASGNGSISSDYTVSNIDNWSYSNQLNREYNTSTLSREAVSVYQQPDSATIAGPQEAVVAYTISNSRVNWGVVNNAKFEDIEYSDRGFTVGQSDYYARTVGGTFDGYPVRTQDFASIRNVLQSQLDAEINSEAWDYSDAFFNLTSPTINNQVGKTILETSTNTLYTVNKRTVSYDVSVPITAANGGYFRDYMKVYFFDTPKIINEYGNEFKLTCDAFILKGRVQQTTYFLDASSVEDAYIRIKPNEIGDCEDSPYNIFCMPYSDTLRVSSDVGYTSSKNLALGVGSNFGAAAGDGAIYDVQILPYCPLQSYLSGNILQVRNLPRTRIENINNELLGELIWLKSSTFSFTINKQITSPTSDIEFKVANECDFYRLCSPNMSSVFEFKPTMFEDGTVTGFEVDCVYKPFNPYIHINPKFSGMYGTYNQYETRGLTLGGDYSLARTSNAWENYELNNKYYQDIFDRNIQSVELQNKYQGIQDIANVVTGTLSAASSGAMVGGMAGGGIGAAVGGVVAGAASLGAGVYDVTVNKKLREEALDLSKDQFGYNLKTIQAIPDTLTRTSVLNQNNPLIPTLEYWTCTDIEKQALRDKIKYNGMTVMRIGTINSFLRSTETYIKARLIRLDFIEDYHVATVIANELNQGVYA